MIDLLFPVLAIGGMGVIFGALLAAASKIFAVKKDERIPLLLDFLPGANCGGCGYAGCSAYAEAMVNENAPVNCCPSCNDEAIAKMAKILGREAGEAKKRKAFVLCNGQSGKAAEKYIYEGISDCHAVMRLAGGNKECKYSCIGLGSCVKKCKFDAISIENGVAVIDRKKCVGCGVCAVECPKNVIRLLPEDTKVQVMCSSLDKGNITRKVCSTGCIGCGICAKNCEQQAIEIKDFNAFIDAEKCIDCGVCIEKCPQKIIHSTKDILPQICVAKKAEK